ncbi:hypothetical protein ACFXHD_08020 [Streptomyces hydrogenans]|uniref:hypothetical protein n=1 Tax=Streptomyces hydrogenans TaxID=1873719 RepID=UPI0036A07A51
MESFRFDSGSLEETEAFLSEAYTPMRIGGRPEDARARVARNEAAGLVSDRLEFGYTMAYDAGCLNRICLVTVHAGSFADTTGGGERLFGPGETFLLAPPDRPYRGEVRSARYTITMFDPGLLAEAAVTGGGFRGPVRITGQRALDAAARRRLGSAVAYVRDQVLGGPGEVGSWWRRARPGTWPRSRWPRCPARSSPTVPGPRTAGTRTATRCAGRWPSSRRTPTGTSGSPTSRRRCR